MTKRRPSEDYVRVCDREAASGAASGNGHGPADEVPF